MACRRCESTAQNHWRSRCGRTTTGGSDCEEWQLGSFEAHWRAFEGMALRLYQAARLLAVTAPDRETIPVGAFLANDGLIMVFQTAVARVGGPCRGAFGELAAAECGLQDRVRRQGP